MPIRFASQTIATLPQRRLPALPQHGEANKVPSHVNIASPNARRQNAGPAIRSS